MKARRLPGVRCSTLKTECRSLLCLMIMPGRICVAGIDIVRNHLLQNKCGLLSWRKAGRPHFPPHTRTECLILHSVQKKENLIGSGFHLKAAGCSRPAGESLD